MKKWIFVFICLLLFSGCTHSTHVKTDMVSKEEKQEDSGYKISYDKAMFQAPDQIYVSEMIAKEIKKEDIFEMLDVPMKETIAKGLDKYHREEIYIWNNEKYELESAKNCYSLILRSKFNKDKKAKQMKIKSEEIQKKATKLFTKWEKIAGVTLDKEHMKMEEAEGEDGRIAIFECNQMYRGTALIGNYNINSPYETNSGEETEDLNDTISGSYCTASFSEDGLRWYQFDEQNFYEEKKKILLKKPLLSYDKVFASMQQLMQTDQYNGKNYDTEEVTFCYVPIPISKDSDVIKLTPCWIILISGDENWISNGKQELFHMKWRFLVDAVSGYVYDAKY